MPFWVNDTLFVRENVDRNSFGFSENMFLVGSFQRDTEGHDLISPKLEKGPDIFVDYITKLHKKNENIHVILSGWRRQYVINCLNKNMIPYSYYELPSNENLKKLYSLLDLYVVSSRYEGGPQSIVECAAMNVPIISTDVGIASVILSSKSVGNDLLSLSPDVTTASENVKKFYISNGGMNWFKDVIKKI
jgi:glycosyltransferase involved in cell wall biosynthesis